MFQEVGETPDCVSLLVKIRDNLTRSRISFAETELNPTRRPGSTMNPGDIIAALEALKNKYQADLEKISKITSEIEKLQSTIQQTELSAAEETSEKGDDYDTEHYSEPGSNQASQEEVVTHPDTASQESGTHISAHQPHDIYDLLGNSSFDENSQPSQDTPLS